MLTIAAASIAPIHRFGGGVSRLAMAGAGARLPARHAPPATASSANASDDPAVVATLARMRRAVSAEGVVGRWAEHHLASGGSAWRARMAVAAGRAAGLDAEAIVAIAAACELVHQASLVHDDVQDGAAMRRSAASVSARYGVGAAVCLGDHLLFAAFGLLAEAGEPVLLRHFSRGLSAVVRGQGDELDPDLWPSMTPARSLQLARAKAGAMAALPIRAVAIAARLPGVVVEQAAEAAVRLGASYQLCDDMEDLAEDAARGAPNGVLAQLLAQANPEAGAALAAALAAAQAGGPAPLLPPAGRAVAACRGLARGLLDEATALGWPTPFAAVIAATAARIGAKLEGGA